MIIGWLTAIIVEPMCFLMMFVLHAEDQELLPRKRSGSLTPLDGVRSVKGQVMSVIIAFIVAKTLTLACFLRLNQANQEKKMKKRSQQQVSQAKKRKGPKGTGAVMMKQGLCLFIGGQ